MKVLQVASSSIEWRGVERHVLNLREGLASLGHDIEIVCPAHSQLGQRLATVPHPLAVRRQRDYRAFLAYLKLFRQHRYDAVHVHFRGDYFVPVLAARLRRQGPIVMSRYVASHWSARQARWVEKLFDRVVPVSAAVAQKLIASGISPSKIEVVLPGVEAPGYWGTVTEARQMLGIVEGPLHVGTFSRLVPEKGLSLLVEAVREIPGVTAHIFSDGPQARELKERAGGIPNVVLHGFAEDISLAICAMDAVVIPTTWEDASPKKALQALAHGKPVLAARIGGHPDVVQDEVNGFLFEANSVSALQSTLEVALSNREALVEMGNRGREQYQSSYTLGRMAERMVNVYQSAQAQRAS